MQACAALLCLALVAVALASPPAPAPPATVASRAASSPEKNRIDFPKPHHQRAQLPRHHGPATKTRQRTTRHRRSKGKKHNVRGRKKLRHRKALRRSIKRRSAIRRYTRGVNLAIRGAKSKAVTVNLRTIRLDKQARLIVRRLRLQITLLARVAQRKAATLMKSIPVIVKRLKAKAKAAVAAIQANTKAAEAEGLTDEVAAAKLQATTLQASYQKKLQLAVKSIKLKVKGILSRARKGVKRLKQEIKRTIREAKARLYAKKLRSWKTRQEMRQKTTSRRLLKKSKEQANKKRIASIKEKKCKDRYNAVMLRYKDTAALCKGMVKQSLKVCYHYLKVYKRVLLATVKTKCSKVPLITKAKNCLKERARYVQRVDRHFKLCSREVESYKPYCYFNLHKHKSWLDNLKAACFPGAGLVVEKDQKKKLRLRRKVVEIRIKRTQRLLRHQQKVEAHAKLVARLKKIRQEATAKSKKEELRKLSRKRLTEYQAKEKKIKAAETLKKSKLSAKQRAKLANKLSKKFVRHRHKFNNLRTNAISKGTGPLADMAKSVNTIAPQLHNRKLLLGKKQPAETASQRVDNIMQTFGTQ